MKINSVHLRRMNFAFANENDVIVAIRFGVVLVWFEWMFMGCRRASTKYMYVMKENSNCEVRALQRSTFYSLKIVCVQNVLWILSRIYHSTATPQRNECANTEHAFHVTFDSFASLQHNQNDKNTVILNGMRRLRQSETMSSCVLSSLLTQYWVNVPFIAPEKRMNHIWTVFSVRSCVQKLQTHRINAGFYLPDPLTAQCHSQTCFST